MENKEQKFKVLMMHEGMNFSVEASQAELDEMSRLMKEQPELLRQGIILLEVARENLAKGQTAD